MELERHESAIRDAAHRHGVDPALLRAICTVESGGDTHAIRYEPGFFRRYVEPLALNDPTEARARAFSWGLMQVMGQVARERGFDGRYLSALCEPETGLHYGAMHLRRFFDRYGDEDRAVAAYNAGSPRVHKGRFVNQAYVDKVMRWKARLDHGHA